MDMDFKDIIEAANTGLRSLGAEVSSPWFYLQFGLILAGAGIAVATNAGQLKVGSFARSERLAKWNEILRIERLLGRDARFSNGSLTAIRSPDVKFG